MKLFTISKDAEKTFGQTFFSAPLHDKKNKHGNKQAKKQKPSSKQGTEGNFLKPTNMHLPISHS